MPVLPWVGIHPGERLQQGRLAVISVPGHREDPHASHERDHTCRRPRIGVSLEGSIRAFTSALHNGQPTGYATCASLNPPITEGVSVMAVVARVPRSRGGVSGVLLILIGAWGGLAPFVGPYFRFAYTPDKAWAYTSGRLWLSIVPGAAALLGGLLVTGAAHRAVGCFGAFFGALALGRCSVVGVKDAALAEQILSGVPTEGYPSAYGQAPGQDQSPDDTGYPTTTGPFPSQGGTQFPPEQPTESSEQYPTTSSDQYPTSTSPFGQTPPSGTGRLRGPSSS